MKSTKASGTKYLILNLGNLFLALILCIVPTIITIGIFRVYGIHSCGELSQQIALADQTNIRELCTESSVKVANSYFIWIWLIVTLPTWRWFYSGHLKRVIK